MSGIHYSAAISVALVLSACGSDLVGQDLEAAQNAIQALTDYKVFFSGSKDLTEQTSVEFGVVKGSESCP